jgi:exopolysaccharide biosynthesis protein
MKRIRFFTFLVAFVIAMPSPLASDPENVNLQKQRVCGAMTYIITANLNDPDIQVKIGLPLGGIPTSEQFLSMVKRHDPVAAVTGTYFDTRSLYPVGSIVIDGKPAHESAIGTAVCFIRDTSFTCETGLKVTVNRTGKGERFNWAGVEIGLRAGPLLLADGKYALNPSREGFRDPGLFGARTRMAIGITSHNKLLLVSVSTPVTFGRLASLMKALGAVDAVCLDGGTSSAMYYKGKIIRYPGRPLTNIIEIHSQPRPVLVKTMEWRPLDGYQPPKGMQYNMQQPWIVAFVIYADPLSTAAPSTLQAGEVYEAAPVPESGLSKSRGAFVPINRAKFTRL